MKKSDKLIPPFMKQLRNIPHTLAITPHITIIGNKQFKIENQYTLHQFATNEIVLHYHAGYIHILGESFLILALYPEEITLTGVIHQIIFKST